MSEVKRYWIYKGTSNFCQELIMDDDYETMVKQKPDGFYDIVSTKDTVEGGVEVVLASDYEKLKAQLEKAETQKHEIIKYCMKNDKFQFMWAATILSIIFDCDFRDASDKAREYFKEKEQV